MSRCSSFTELPTLPQDLDMPRVALHVLFWLMYVLALTYLNVTYDVTSFDLLPEGSLGLFYQQFTIQVIWLVVKIPFVYGALVLLNRYLNQQGGLGESVVVFLLFLSLGAIAMSLLNHGLILPHIMHEPPGRYSVFSTGSLMYHALSLSFVTGMAAAVKLMRWRHQAQLRVAQLQKEMTEAELRYLKGQINPHFLFNTLNNIYSLARKGSAATAESVLRLSKLMRFVVFEASQSRLLLRNEIALIEDYIELERLRYTDRLQVDFIHELDNPDQEIAPLLLIHFVENAFKHGISETHNHSFVNINIKLSGNLLSMVIINSVPPTADKTQGATIGLENIRRQLELQYPKHRLDIMNTSDTFQITLTIPLV